MTKRLKTLNVEFNKKDFELKFGIPVYQINDKKEALKNLNKIFIDASIVYFGIHSSQIQEAVILKASQKIIQELNQISLEEVAFAFERIEIQRQVTLTLEDLIQPVRKYIYSKNYISAEAKKIMKEQRQEEEELQQEKRFEQESIKIYIQSLSSLKWNGTIFHALTLAKKFELKKRINSELVFELWDQTKIEFAEIQKEVKNEEKSEIANFLKHYGKTPERIFAEKLVVECIKKKIEL